MHHRGPHAGAHQPDLPGSQEVFFRVSAAEATHSKRFVRRLSALFGESSVTTQSRNVTEVFFLLILFMESLLMLICKKKHAHEKLDDNRTIRK